MKLRLQLFFDSLRYSYITVPMSLAVLGLFLAWATLNLDAMSLNIPGGKAPSRALLMLRFGESLLYSGGVDGARALLGAIAGSIISVAALASSIAITALALASGQFGSRLLRNFMDDRGFQITLGVFNGTFLFCLVILRATRDTEEGGGGVPQISITVALALAVACVFLLIYFLHHMARSVQAPYVVADAARSLNAEIERLFGKSVQKRAAAPAELAREFAAATTPDWNQGLDIEAHEEGYIKAINYDELIRLARRHRRTFKMNCRAGDWIGGGDTLLTVWPPTSAATFEKGLRRCFLTGRDRSALQDPEYGIRQLVEIASRALSPAINDPFTAMTCLDHLGASLGHVLRCEIPPPFLVDEGGELRVIVKNVTFARLCDASFNMIRQYGATSPAVIIRMLETQAKVGAKCQTDEEREAVARHARLARDEALKETSVDRDVADIEDRYARALRAIAERRDH